MKLKINPYFVFVLLAAALWGTANIYVENLSRIGVSEMQTVLGRAVFTAGILGVIILIKDIKLLKVRLKDLWIFISGGIFSIVLFNFSYYKTMHLTNSPAIAAVLLYTAPFFVVIISVLFFKERLTFKKTVALFTAFVGCCLVSGLFASSGKISAAAVGFGLLTGFGYALYTIFGDMLIKRGYKTLTITFYVFLFATLGTVPFVDLNQTAQALNLKSLGWTLAMSVFNTVLPYILYTTGLKGVSSSSAPIIATLEPVVAAVVGALVFHKYLSFTGIIGMALVLSSVIILNLKSKNKITAVANAKINLSLDITGKREDGYHLIDTVMQSVTLSDIVTVKKAKDIKVTSSKPELSGKDNICHKAAELFFEKTEIGAGAHVFIKKNIPQAAGLGGGSADAAATLLGLDSLYKTNLSYEALCNIALKLGADVPFFITGGTKRAEGIGEKLTDLKPFNLGCFVLAKADSKPSTKEMYQKLDNKEHKAVDTQAVIKYCETNDLKGLCSVMDNSFASVWGNNLTLERLKKFESSGVGLSGSGPTYFIVFESREKAKLCEKQLKKEGIFAFTVTPTPKAIVFAE